MANRGVNAIQPVQHQEFLNVLRTFLDTLRSSMGPQGGLKVLVTGGGVSTTTSSSSRLLSNITIAHPLCRLISQVMKSQVTVYGDYGLYTGALTCSLVEKFLKQDLMKPSEASRFLLDLFPEVFTSLDSGTMKIKLDFSSVKQLIPLVKTILSSKPTCCLSKNDIHHLSVQIVKVFLNTVDEDFGEVVVVDSGSSQDVNIVLNGLLYQINGDELYIRNVLAMISKERKDIPLVLFNIMLTNTELKRRDKEDILIEETHDFTKSAQVFLEHVVRSGVKIVACQKVVDGALRLYLQRHKIVLLDRLGTEMSKAVERLTGAKPISCVGRMSDECLKCHLGFVESAKSVCYGERHFILLERHAGNVATVLLHGPSEDAFDELKAVVYQALAALRQVTCQPFVVPGAGCSEMWLAVKLGFWESQSDNAEKFKYKEATTSWLQKALLYVAGIDGVTANFCAADTAYYHCWKSWDSTEMERCHCGLVRTSDVLKAEGKWVQPNCITKNELVFPKSIICNPQPIAPKGIHEDAIIDVCVSKCNALKLALDTCIQILNIGLIVYSTPEENTPVC